SNLTQQVSMIRKALGESPGEDRYIVTVPGRGYRFAAEVRVRSMSPGTSASDHTQSETLDNGSAGNGGVGEQESNATSGSQKVIHIESRARTRSDATTDALQSTVQRPELAAAPKPRTRPRNRIGFALLAAFLVVLALGYAMYRRQSATSPSAAPRRL